MTHGKLFSTDQQSSYFLNKKGKGGSPDPFWGDIYNFQSINATPRKRVWFISLLAIAVWLHVCIFSTAKLAVTLAKHVWCWSQYHSLLSSCNTIIALSLFVSISVQKLSKFYFIFQNEISNDFYLPTRFLCSCVSLIKSKIQ